MWFRDVNISCVENVPQQSVCGTVGCSLVAAHNREKAQKKDLTMAMTHKSPMVRVFYKKRYVRILWVLLCVTVKFNVCVIDYLC